MREHPIPQDITGYRFHIIGTMTLKQFAEIAAGVLIGVIIYTTNLLPIIKWPLIAVFVGIGVAAAFLPIAEQPLDHWITTFIKVMYRPTKFFWKKASKVPEPFLYEQNKAQQIADEIVDMTPARQERIREYLASVRARNADPDYDPDEEARIENIMTMFSSIKADEIQAIKQVQKPDLKVRVRSLQTRPDEVPGFVDTSVTIYEQQPERETIDTKHVAEVQQVAQEVVIPETAPTEVETPEQITEVAAAQSQNGQENVYVEEVQPAATNGQPAQQSATLNAALPFPNKPTEPNKLVGMILTPNNELIPEAIVEILNENSRVVRAVKSNALGQFYITTPLKAGTYSLIAEKDGYQFQPQQLVLENEIVDPIEIRSV